MQHPPVPFLDRIGLEKLAALPQVTLRLLQACNDPRVGLAELADIIARDGALFSRIIQVANSPLYGQRGFTDLQRVLAVLGFATIRTIAITAGVMEVFARFHPRRGHWLGTFWQRSLLCAHLGRGLAQQSGYAHPEEVYLIGLLHKVGQLVFLNSEPEQYGTLLQDALDPGKLRKGEQRLFAIDHVELGAWLAGRWGLDGLPSEAIRYQQEPTEQVRDAPALIRLINLAARLSDPWFMAEARSTARQQVGLAQETLEPLWNQAQQEVIQAAQSFAIEITPWETSPSEPQTPFPPDRAVLADAVRDMALLESLKAALRDESADGHPHLVIQKFLTLLFGLDRPEIFLAEPGRGLWHEGRPEFSVPLDPERSLLGYALGQQQAIDSFQYQRLGKCLNILDRLLIQSHGGPGILALPLVARGEQVGMVVVGATPDTLSGFGPYLGLLQLFLAEAAELVLRRRDIQRQHRLLVAEGQAQALLNARKVRHEANNPLGILTSYLHLLGMKLGSDHPVQADLDMLTGEIERVSNILGGLTERLTDTDSRAGPVRVNELITRLEAVWRASLFLEQALEVRLELDTALPPITTDVEKLKQILLNLVKNAVEAMPDGGELVLGTRASVWMETQRCVEILIRDSGPGLPSGVQERLFEPVPSGKGDRHAGLGLSITGQLVRALGGRIQCRTGYAGTEFAVLLPLRPMPQEG